jgi:hypothetical protein
MLFDAATKPRIRETTPDSLQQHEVATSGTNKGMSARMHRRGTADVTDTVRWASRQFLAAKHRKQAM